MRKAVYGENATHPDIANSYSNIGITHDSMSKYSKALEYYTKSLDMRKAVYGENATHPDIANSYNNIGGAYHSMSKYSEALECHTKSL